MDDVPEWAGRQVLAQALKSCGLPFVPSALWRHPRPALTYAEQVLAIEMSIRVFAEARQLLPRGVSGATLGAGWRDAAWRCIVAGIAMLDDAARARLTGQRHEEPVAQAEPVSVRRAPPRHDAAVAPSRPAASPVRFRIYRAGEVPHAS